jgi:hypothetical protein
MTSKKFKFWVTQKNRRALRTVVHAYCAGDTQVLESINIDSVVARIDAYFMGLPLNLFIGLRFMIFLLEYAVPPLALKFRPMSRMKYEDQVHYLESWHHSRFLHKRLPVFGLKFICLSQIYSENKILDQLGYLPALQERMSGQCTSAPLT